jgi:hypothetical protein
MPTLSDDEEDGGVAENVETGVTAVGGVGVVQEYTAITARLNVTMRIIVK